MLERRSADIFCVRKTRYGEMSVRMMIRKAAEYKLPCIEKEKGLEE